MQINPIHDFDISVLVPWLTVLSSAIAILAWYVKVQAREGMEKVLRKMQEKFASKEHVSYVEGMLKQAIENKFQAVAIELKHVTVALREVKTELKLLEGKTPTDFN